MSATPSEKNPHGLVVPDAPSILLETIYAAVQQMSDGFLTVDRENRILYMNPAAEAITGWSLAEALGRPSGIVLRVLDALTGRPAWQPIMPVMREDRRYTLLPNTVLLRKDLTEVPVEDTASPMHNSEGQVTGAVITFRDVGAVRILLRQALERAHRDPLTSLPDRTLLEERFNRWRTSPDDNTGLALLYLDMDQFKEINDTHGHLAGDFVLQTTAHRIRTSIPEDALAYRLGGDEFAILLEADLANNDPVQRCIDTLLQVTSETISYAGANIEVTMSLGAVIRNEKRIGIQDLLGSADEAMYRAKHAGGNKAEWNIPPSHAPTPLRSSRLPEQPEIDPDHVMLHYQPIVDLGSGKIVAAEALVRYSDAGHPATLPQDFISNAERSGHILRLGQAVLRKALRQQDHWRRLGHTDLTMNVNVSAVELVDPLYLEHLDCILQNEAYQPSRVTLELTESVLLQAKQQPSVVKALTERGLRIAIDDFGVGYSNLSYLRQFPISMIKIDREFLQQVPYAEQDSNLVKAMITMAHTLRCSVIAEGVETEAQKSYLQELACPQAQGFLFSPPVAPEHFLSLLQSSS